MGINLNRQFQIYEIENICKEAVAKLRKNKGCDIDYIDFRGGDTSFYNPSGQLKISVCYLKLKFHGIFGEFAMQSDIFDDHAPRTQEEDNILVGTRSVEQMIILRVAKIIFENYKQWLRNQGLANKITSDVTTTGSACANMPVYVDHDISNNRLHIGNQVVNIDDTFARDAIQKLHDELDMERQKSQGLQSKVDYMEAVLRSKGLL